MMRRASQNEKMASSSVSLARSAKSANGNSTRSKRTSIFEVVGQDKMGVSSKQQINTSDESTRKSIWSRLLKFPSFRHSKKESKSNVETEVSEEPSNTVEVTTSAITSTTNVESEPELQLLQNNFERIDIVSSVGDEDVADIIIAYANKYVELAERIVHENPRATLSRATKLLCGKSAAKMPLAVYLARMVGLLNQIYDKDGNHGVHSTGLEIIMMASAYIDRVLETSPEFILCPLNIHRTLFAAVIGAIKYSEDRVPDKFLMATIGGVDVKQASAIETRFCTLINFRYYVSDEDLQNQFDKLCFPLDISVRVKHGNDE